MRWLVTAVILAFLAAGGAYGVLARDRGRLREFCDGLELGTSILDVRRVAKRGGFRSTLEPHGQVRVELGYSSILPGSCRIFFNPNRTLEYRKFEAASQPPAP